MGAHDHQRKGVTTQSGAQRTEFVLSLAGVEPVPERILRAQLFSRLGLRAGGFAPGRPVADERALAGATFRRPAASGRLASARGPASGCIGWHFIPQLVRCADFLGSAHGAAYRAWHKQKRPRARLRAQIQDLTKV